MTINEKIKSLENRIQELEAKLQNTNINQDNNYQKPVSVGGVAKLAARNRAVDTKSGHGAIFGGAVIWNDSELEMPPINEEPEEPSKGYNKHTHSSFSGGALLADYLEVVQYDWNSINIENKHSQGYWPKVPKIKEAANKDGQLVPMLGPLSLSFSADARAWGCATYEIDVENCNFVMYEIDEETGERTIKRDEKNQEMISPLYNEDITKTSILWDENAGCWRLIAVYAPEPEVPEA